VRPAPGEAVRVFASISDSDGVTAAAIRYQLTARGSGAFQTAAMADDGAAPDLIAGDGVYAGTLPGFNNQDRVLFYIEATDSTGAVRTYPVDAPAHTLVFQADNPLPSGLPVYRLVMDEDNRSYLETRQLHSDDPVYGSLVYDDVRIIYNVGLHYHGSPWNRPGFPRMYKLDFPNDRSLLGTKKFNISRYGSSAREAAAYYTIRRTGRPDSPAPASDYRFVRWMVNGADQGIMSHVETVDSAYVSRRMNGGGSLYRANGKITFHLDDNWNLTGWATVNWRGADKEAYRYNYDLHTDILADDWTHFVDWMRVMDPSQTSAEATFTSQVKSMVDVEEFIRAEAMRVLNDDWDAVGVGNGQNVYFYWSAADGKWRLLPWDMDHTFANAGATLWPTVDPGINRFIVNVTEFKRIYLQSIKEALDRTWNVPRMSKFLDPMAAKGVAEVQAVKDFIAARTPSIRNILGTVTAFRNRTNGGKDITVATTTTTLDGDAPLDVRAIILNGEPVVPPALSWTTPTAWRLKVNLIPGTNLLEFDGFDGAGNFFGKATITITSTANWNPPQISGVAPSSGSASGGTAVTITGSDFHDGAKVAFGGVDATGVTVVSATEIQATAPAGTGQVDVKVTNLDGRFTVMSGGYTYLATRFIRGDADGSGALDISDAIASLEYLFLDGTLACLEAADANDDGAVDISDPVRLVLFLFGGGPAIPPPYPALGVDSTPDSLGCAAGK
jgi:hypothetical protein